MGLLMLQDVGIVIALQLLPLPLDQIVTMVGRDFARFLMMSLMEPVLCVVVGGKNVGAVVVDCG